MSLRRGEKILKISLKIIRKTLIDFVVLYSISFNENLCEFQVSQNEFEVGRRVNENVENVRSLKNRLLLSIFLSLTSCKLFSTLQISLNIQENV